MVPFPELLVPIALSAVLVFVASSLIHMVVRWHNPDYRKLPNEDEVRAVIRKGAPPPGQYVVPHCLEGGEAATPEMQKKFAEGPIATVFVKPTGPMQLGPFLGKWFVYCIVVSAVVAYLTGAVLAPGTPYLTVFRVAGTAAWLAYAWEGPSSSIWKGQPWAVTAKNFVDGLVYAALTAGAFAWRWPA